MYPAAYTVECSLKALILQRTPETEWPNAIKKISSGSSMHGTEVLAGELKGLGCAIPLELVKRLGVDGAQGYHIGRPHPISALPRAGSQAA